MSYLLAIGDHHWKLFINPFESRDFSNLDCTFSEACQIYLNFWWQQCYRYHFQSHNFIFQNFYHSDGLNRRKHRLLKHSSWHFSVRYDFKFFFQFISSQVSKLLTYSPLCLKFQKYSHECLLIDSFLVIKNNFTTHGDLYPFGLVNTTFHMLKYVIVKQMLVFPKLFCRQLHLMLDHQQFSLLRIFYLLYFGPR